MAGKGGLFGYADRVHKRFMMLGALGSVGHGLMSPLTMLVLSLAINDYGVEDASFFNKIVDKHALRLFVVAIYVGCSAFIEGACWTRTAERQSSRIRMEYLKSVLQQEVGFLDSQDASSTSFRVVSAITSDARSVQDAIAEKIPNSLAHFTAFIFSIIVAFVLSCRLALSALPFSLLFVIPGVGLGKLLMNLAYDVAGGTAEQAISSVRTEHQTVTNFSNALQKTMDLGIRQGFTKGLLIFSIYICK